MSLAGRTRLAPRLIIDHIRESRSRKRSNPQGIIVAEKQIRSLGAFVQPAILAYGGVMAGFLGVQTTRLASTIVAGWPALSSLALSFFCAGYLTALVLSLFWAFLTVYPRLDVKQPKSKIFFAHIAEEYGTNYDEAAKDLVEMTEADLSADAAKQVVANSVVCAQKAKCLKRALLWMGISLACWVATLLLLFATT